MNHRKIILSILLAILPAVVFAQTALEATAVTDKTKANLGDVIRYTLTVKRQGDMSQPPSVVLPSFEGFRVSGSYTNSMMNFINGAASSTNQQIVDLIAVKSGEVVINPAKIRFMNPAVKQYENLETKAITVTIGQGKRRAAAAIQPTATAVPVEPDIRSIKYNYSFDLSGLWLYVLLALVFIAAAYFAWKKIFGKKTILPAAAVPEDYRKTALRRIKKAGEILKAGEVKAYYSELYEAIREFLNVRFNSTFGELTTQEIIKKLGGLNAAKADCVRILDFMKEADLVKFADYKPSDKEAGDIEAKAEEIVNKTA